MRRATHFMRHTVCVVLLMPFAIFAQNPPAQKPPGDTAARLYASHCGACHQENGLGMSGAFPPLAGHVPNLLARAGGREYLLRVVLFGLAGEISVNSQPFSGAMPPWESLSDADIAVLLNHAATNWGNARHLPADFKPFYAGEVAAARADKLQATAVHTLRRKLMPAAAQVAAAAGVVTYTESQAAEGKAVYQRNCEDCHGSTLDNGEFGGAPLRGSWFRKKWGNGSVANLYAFTKAKMPPDRPGGLSDKVYADVVAFILSVNGYKAGNQELPTDPQAQQPLSLKRE